MESDASFSAAKRGGEMEMDHIGENPKIADCIFETCGTENLSIRQYTQAIGDRHKRQARWPPTRPRNQVRQMQESPPLRAG